MLLLERKDPPAATGSAGAGGSGPKPIRDAIRQFLRENRLRRPAAHERVFQAWTEALGAEWRPHAWPVAFQGGRLVVEVESPVHLYELRNFRGEGYRGQANRFLGEELIRRVVFKVRG